MAAESYAIVVGLNHYPGITQLQGPENDATWFRDWLTKHKLVDPANATLILSSAFPAAPQTIDAKPDTVAVDQAFERLLRIGVQKDKVGKRLYLFFSGHGFSPTLNDAALLMANCEAGMGITGHYVNAVYYADFFARAAYFDEIVLFMDCCRDDLWQAPSRCAPWQAIRNVGGGQVKRFYGLATRWAQKAREAAVQPGGPVHGHFTRALMAALDGGAVNKASKLTTGAVLGFTNNYVQAVIKPELVKLNLPAPEPDFVQKDDFVLATGLVPTLTPVTVTFSAPNQAGRKDFTLAGGQPLTFARNEAGDDPWHHDVPFGEYQILSAAGQTVASFAAVGQKVDVHV